MGHQQSFFPGQRTKNVHYAIRDIVVQAQNLVPKGMPILPLNIGDPLNFDFKTPPHILRAVIKTLGSSSSYAPSEGIPSAREAVAQYQKRFGIKGMKAEDVLITNGGAEAISLALSAILNPKDNVLIPCPGYPAYEAQINFLEAEPRNYFLDEENNWQIDPGELESLIDKKTKALVVINPNNPTGAVLKEKVLAEVLRIAKKHHLVVVADEQVYPFYVYEGKTKMSASLGIDVPVITLGSMSKTYLVPGWRVGWLVFNDSNHQLDSIKETIFRLKRIQLGSVHPFQQAVAPALLGSHKFLNRVRKKLIKRRNLLVEGINKIKGLSLVKPKAAFYAFVRIDKPIKSDTEFVLKLAQKTGILGVPGEGLGQKPGTYHFRVVFLPPEKILTQALEKLAIFLKNY